MRQEGQERQKGQKRQKRQYQTLAAPLPQTSKDALGDLSAQ